MWRGQHGCCRWQPHSHVVSLAAWNTFAQICEKWLVHQRVIVAQLQVVVSDSHQVDQNRRVEQTNYASTMFFANTV